jgi:Ulp1 family protease
VPQQDNLYDCGVFLCLFELGIYKQRLNPTIVLKDLIENAKEFFKATITQSEIENQA